MTDKKSVEIPHDARFEKRWGADYRTHPEFVRLIQEPVAQQPDRTMRNVIEDAFDTWSPAQSQTPRVAMWDWT